MLCSTHLTPYAAVCPYGKIH